MLQDFFKGTLPSQPLCSHLVVSWVIIILDVLSILVTQRQKIEKKSHAPIEIQHERTHWSRDTDWQTGKTVQILTVMCFSRCLHWPAETELRGASVQQDLHTPPLRTIHLLRLLFLLRAAEAGQRFATPSSHRDVFILVFPTGQRVAAGRLRDGLGYLALMLHFKSQPNRVQDWVCVKTHLRTFCLTSL